MRRDRFHFKWLLILLMTVAGILWIVSLTPLIGDGYDDTRYVALSRAIAIGEGFCRPSIPGCQPEIKYPIGYPLLLTPVWLVWPAFPQNVMGFKMVSVLAAVLIVSLSYVFFTKYDYLARWEAIIVVALTAFAPEFFAFATMAFSEVVFTAFSILALITLERYGRDANDDRRSWLPAVLSSVFAFYIRTVGIALGASGVIYFVFKREVRKAWRFGAAFAIGLLPWLLRTMWLEVRQSTYLDQLLALQVEVNSQGHVTTGELLIRVIQNIRAYALAGLPGVILPSQVPLAHVNLATGIQVGTPLPGVDIILGTLIVAGFITHLFFQRRLLDFYVLCYLGICLLWPWEPLRLSIPLIPFLFYYLWFEGRTLALAIGQQWPGIVPLGRAVVVGLIVVWIMVNGFYQARFAYYRHIDPFSEMRPADQRRWQGLYDLFTWVKHNVEPDEVLASLNDDRLYLYTGRYTTRDLTTEGLVRDGVDYVVHIPYGGVMVEADLSWDFIKPMMVACPGAFEEVYADPPTDMRVFEVDRAKIISECETK